MTEINAPRRRHADTLFKTKEIDQRTRFDDNVILNFYVIWKLNLKDITQNIYFRYQLMLFFSLVHVTLFYTPTKSWRGYIFTAVCLCICECVCPALLVNKIPAERIHRFGRSYR